MARTTKRARVKIPPVITKLLKAVNELPVEEAADELQLAFEEEPSMEKRRTLMKARIKLLEDAQKPKKPTRRTRKKAAPKPKKVEEEVVEVAPEPEPEPAPEPENQGTVMAMDLDNLGALFGAAEPEEGEAAGGDTPAAAPSAGGELDLSALDALGGGDGEEAEAGAAPAPAAGAAEMDLSALAALGGDDADADAAPAAAITPPPAAPEPEPEPEAPPKPQFKKEKIKAPDYADDEMYQQIWAEMKQEGLDKLTKVRLSEDGFEDRLEQARKDADWLGFGAKRMGDADWANTANAIAFDCDHIDFEWELDQRLNTGITDLAALDGTDAPDLPAVEVPDTPAPKPAPKPEPVAEAPPAPEPDPAPAPKPEPAAAMDPMASMDALFAEMGDGDGASDEGALEFDEDLSAEELAAKNAAKEADMEEAAAERPVQHGDNAAAKMAAAEAAPEAEAPPEPAPAAEAAPETAKETAAEPAPVEDVDEGPLSAFAQDEMYCQIWEEMVVETLQGLQITRKSGGDFESRQKKADFHADRLCYAARQMEFPRWIAPLEEFAFDCPALEDAAALDAAIDKLVGQLQALRGGKPPVDLPEGALEAAEAEAAAEAEVAEETPAAEPAPAPAPAEPAAKPADGMANMDSLFAEMGDSSHSNDDDVFDFDDDSDGADESSASAEDASEEEAEAAEPAPAPEPVESSVEIDTTPISTFAEDHLYMKIWEEMVVETLEQLGLARQWQAEFDARLKRADDTAARLLHAATQMEFADWVKVLEDFAFDVPVLEDENSLDAAIDKVRVDLQALRGDKPEVEIPAEDTYTPPVVDAQPAPKAAAPAPEVEEADIPKAPKALVTDTYEGAQKRDDWDSDDFWSWDDDDGSDAAEAAADTPADPEPPQAAEPAAEPAPAPAPAPEIAPETASPVEIDPTPISAFNEDDGFQKIFDEMVEETLEALGVQRRSDDGIADRLSKSRAHADRLLHAAEQMEYAPWVETLNGFLGQSPADANALNGALDQLIADLDLLKGGAVAVANLMAQAPVAAAEPAPAAPSIAPNSMPTPKAEAPHPAPVTAAAAQQAAQSREGKATLDDIYKFFPKG